MTVICPADATEAYAAVEACLNHDGPCYLRFGRYAVPDITRDVVKDYKFEIGKGVLYREGSDVTIVANGFMVHLAVEAAEMLAAEGISAEVINIHTVKPLDADMIERSAVKTGAIVTAEEHSVKGGLGSAVCEAMSERYPVPVLRVGVQDKFGRSGQVPELLEMYGLTAANIAETAKRAIALKKA
jgi:transketolase